MMWREEEISGASEAILSPLSIYQDKMPNAKDLQRFRTIA